MRHTKLFYKQAIAILISCVFLPAVAQDFKERMVYEGHYAVEQGASLEMSNKYGDIQLYNWDKDSVYISTEMILSSTSYSNLRKLKDKVKVKYNQHDQHIIAYTSFNDNTSEVLNQLQEFTKSIIHNQVKRIEVNYTVFMPKYMALKIRNQYGDITLDDVMGSVDIDLFNGALSANRLSGASLFDLRYAKANISQINDGFFKLIYSDLDLNKSISLNVESKISDIHLQDVGVFKVHSTRDDINIDHLSYLYGESMYSKIRINELTNELNCDMSFGKIDISRLDSTCSLIDIKSDRTDVNIYAPKKMDFTYDINYHPDAMVRLPFPTETNLNQAHDLLYNIHGQKGNSQTPLSIKITAYKRCLVRIQDAF